MSCERGPFMTSVDSTVQSIVLPLQVALFGCLVYMAYQRKSQATRIVAQHGLMLLTLADFLLLLTFVPQFLASFRYFYSYEPFRRWFATWKIGLNAVSNVLSAAEVFLTISVVSQILFATTNHKLHKHSTSAKGFVFLCVAAFLFCLPVCYHFFLYSLHVEYVCGGEKLVSRILLNSFFSPRVTYMLNVFNGFLIVLMPCVLIPILVRKIIKALKRGQSASTEHLEGLPLCKFGESSKEKIASLPIVLNAIAVFFVFSHAMSMLSFLPDLFPSLWSPNFTTFIIIMNAILVFGKEITLACLYHCSLSLPEGYLPF